MQGNANRILLGIGSTGAGDVISGTLPLDTRWDIVPGTMRFWAARSIDYGWTSYNGPYIGKDDGVGGFDPDGSGYNAVTASINYQTGAVTFNENTDDPLTGSNTALWVEYYERFPSNTPADDFDISFMCSSESYYPLILHRFDHASFASRNLVNHGQWCMSARQQSASHTSAVEMLLKAAALDTDRPVMSEIAIRNGYNQPVSPSQGVVLGPMLIQRCESLTSLSRAGYRWGPWVEPAFSSDQGIALVSGNSYGLSTKYYDPLASGIRPRLVSQGNLTRTFPSNVDNVLPNLLGDDWHLYRMTTSFDADPGDLHIHLQMAIGHTEVDKANPTFQTFADIWHQQANNTPIYTAPPAFPSKSDSLGSWNQNPHAYPPMTGRQGFVLGSTQAPSANNITVYFDAFRCHYMLV